MGGESWETAQAFSAQGDEFVSETPNWSFPMIPSNVWPKKRWLKEQLSYEHGREGVSPAKRV